MATSPLPTLTPLDLKCDRYYTERNKTAIIYGGYQGIPENLLINSVVWLVSIPTNLHLCQEKLEYCSLIITTSLILGTLIIYQHFMLLFKYLIYVAKLCKHIDL